MERERQADHYPYAASKTFKFLKAATAEGAHLQVPDKLNPRWYKKLAITKDREPTAEEIWVQMRNFAGTYFSSWVSLEELGDRYGFSKETASRYIGRFIDYLWKNCSEATQKRFPRFRLATDKPQVGTFARKAFDYSQKKPDVLLLASMGTASGEINQLTGVSLHQVKRMIRQARAGGNLEMTKQKFGFLFNRRLRDRLANPSVNPLLRQKYLGEVNEHFLQTNPDLFVTVTDCCREAGWKGGMNSKVKMERAVCILEAAEVPNRPLSRTVEDKDLMRQRILTRYIVLTFDHEAAVSALKNWEGIS